MAKLHTFIAFLHALLIVNVAAQKFGRRNFTALVYGANSGIQQSMQFICPALDLAVRDVNARFGGQFQLTLKYAMKHPIRTCQDVPANFDMLLEAMYTAPTSPIAIFYGGCDDSRVLQYSAAEADVAIYSIGTKFPNIRDRTLYSTTISLASVQYEGYTHGIHGLLSLYNWTTVAYIYDTSDEIRFNTIVFDEVVTYLKNSSTDIQVIPFRINVTEDTDFNALLRSISLSSRVVIMSVTTRQTRSLMAWIHVPVALSSRPTLEFILENELNNDDRSWAGSSMIVTICWLRDPSSRNLTDEMKRLSKEVYNYTYSPKVQPSEFSLTAYRSVVALAQILNETDFTTSGRTIAQNMINRTFHIPNAGILAVDERGEKRNPVCIKQLDSLDDVLKTKAIYHEDKWDVRESISWFGEDAAPPANEPFCGFRGDKPVCQSRRTVAAISTGSSLIVFVMSVFIIIRWYIQSVSCYRGWKIKLQDLTFSMINAESGAISDVISHEKHSQ